MIKGSEAIIKCLEQENVEVIFGYPGATVCPIYDSLINSSIRNILVRNEQHAGHAANGYARTTGKVGVCMATSGPGAMNLLTAVATANMDSIPMVAITGQVSSDLLGKDVFQEVDVIGSAEPFTKYTFLVKDINEIPTVFKQAFHIANTGRKGPVLIDITVDIMEELINFKYDKYVSIRGYKPTLTGHSLQVKKALKAINEAKKPLICAGGGIMLSNAQPELLELSTRLKIPVVSTMMGIGAVKTEYERYFGMIGTSGFAHANRALNDSDLLIIIGARVANRAMPNCENIHKNVIHIDIDPAEIGKNIKTTIPIVGDAKVILNQMLDLKPTGDFSSFCDDITSYKTEKEIIKRDGFINPQILIRALSNKLDNDAIYVADVGQNQIWSAKNYNLREGSFLTSGGMGTMGYSIPAAIGAKIGKKDTQVIAVCGDGSFQMCFPELATLKQHNVDVKIIVMTNNCLGMIRQIQTNSFDKRFTSIDLSGNPKLDMIAKAYDMGYIYFNDMDKIDDVISNFISHDGPCILECSVYPYEMAE